LPRLWRISKHLDLSGEGGLRASNRWNSRGRPIVYLAHTASGVLLESLVHLLEGTALPDGYMLIEVEYPQALAPEQVTEEELPPNWVRDVDVTRKVGDGWLKDGRSALLDVPSVIAPATRNMLLNPRHPDASDVVIHRHTPFAPDPRLRQLADYAISYREEGSLVLRDE
jgi:RES domain-containing protein